VGISKWLFGEHGGRKRKYRPSRDDGWMEFTDRWEASVFAYKGEEVLTVRHRWSHRVLATVVWPQGTASWAPPGWLEGVVMGIARQATSVNGEENRWHDNCPAWAKEFTVLWEYLTHDTYLEGEPRVPSTITIMRGDLMGVKVVLNDRDRGLSLWSTGTDPRDALETLELLLNTTSPPWRKDALKTTLRKSGK